MEENTKKHQSSIAELCSPYNEVATNVYENAEIVTNNSTNYSHSQRSPTVAAS